MDKSIYKYSDKFLDKKKKFSIYFFGVILLFLAVTSFSIVGLDLITFLMIVTFTLVAYFSFRFSHASMKNYEIHLTAYGIERKNGDKIETFLYKDIKKITIKSNKSGEFKFIEVNLPKKILSLSGFDDMNGLITELKNKVSPDVIKQKTMILDWSSPIISVSFMLAGLIVAYLVAYFGLSLVQQFTNLDIGKITGVIFLLLGVELIYMRSSFRAGLYSEKYDVGLGIVFILWGLFDIFM